MIEGEKGNGKGKDEDDIVKKLNLSYLLRFLSLSFPCFLVNPFTNPWSKYRLRWVYLGFQYEKYLPTSFNAVEIWSKRTTQDPNLRQAELIRLLNLGLPNIHCCLCPIVLSLHIGYCMLIKKNMLKSRRLSTHNKPQNKKVLSTINKKSIHTQKNWSWKP